jgi:dGTPase
VPHFPGSRFCSEKKYGFFQSEKERFNNIATELGLLRKSSESGVFFHRHPLAFLVEAADDICYRIVDFEDGCKLGLIPAAEGKKLLKDLLEEPEGKVSRIHFSDWREEIGFLRAKIIGKLIAEASEIFLLEEEAILDGRFDKALIGELNCKPALDEIKKLSIQKIYQNRPVLEIEAAGFEVLGGLLDVFLNAVFYPQSRRNQKMLDLIPDQFIGLGRKISTSDYEKILNITDFISGLTDQAAITLYRKIKGISLPKMY